MKGITSHYNDTVKLSGRAGECPFVTTLSLHEKHNGTKFKISKAAFSLSANVFRGVPQGYSPALSGGLNCNIRVSYCLVLWYTMYISGIVRLGCQKGQFIIWSGRLHKMRPKSSYAGIWDFLNISLSKQKFRNMDVPKSPHYARMANGGRFRSLSYLSRNILENPYDEVRHKGAVCAVCLWNITSLLTP